MRYRLGLDLGVSSIGAAVISLDKHNEAADILDASVRIFNVSEGAEKRREKRQARKNNERTKQRLKLLAERLHAQGLWASDNRYTLYGKAGSSLSAQYSGLQPVR